MIIQELIDKYFTAAHSELGEENYLVSKNSKFILDFNDNKTMSLKPNSENLNNKKIKRYWELQNKSDLDFHQLEEEDFKKIINDIYS